MASATPNAGACDQAIRLDIEAEIATINYGMQIYTSVPEAERTDEQRRLLASVMTLLDSRDRPVSQADVDILDAALGYLSSEAVWDRADDRRCGQQDTRWSIFCALQRASVDVTGTYEHRRTALQEVRFIIEVRSEGRDYAHRMMDYNNDPETSFDEARAVVSEARAVVADRLSRQCPAKD
ncbi:hypothetical protein [Maricaulis sp.]|uniref:DUF6197 family protein n=1 Tax=Maricaulis sp. TaxID=1486257 RepID=UPI0025B7F54D|nr:hypothetical protein [Maricaulis sp.]